MHYYAIAPTKIIRQDTSAFTYATSDALTPGALVVVPVGKTELIGVVMTEVVKPDFDVKPIARILDEPPLPLPLVQTALWMSRYYTTHLGTVWQTVLPTGLAKKRRASRPAAPTNAPNRTKKVFTDQQRRAIAAIADMAAGTMLLHGVTGSGKTLVYIEAARQAIADDRSVIVLVPEIALTAQLVAEFAAAFPRVIVSHSRQTEAQRHLAWQEAIRADEPIVVIGPRSALFAPVHDVGLIVIDECHEPSFKQEQAPRYSALRAAAILAQQHNAKLVLGSATPSVSDYFLAKRANRPIVRLTAPASPAAAPPTITVVDMTKRQHFTRHFFLSNELLAAMENTLDASQQVLLFHNRRGSAAVTLCQQCGWSAGCPRCFVPLTLHADRHQLICHICGQHSPVLTSCPACHHADIIHKGIGTKRIEEEVVKLFPNKKVVRFDKDAPDQQTVDALYNELKAGNIDIIIGTQVIAKGLDLPQLRTVGIVQADTGLSLPDFTAPERTFQLLAQAIGRVGRSHHRTDVVVQTFQPDHPAIADGIQQNYDDFYRRTIAQRRHTNFPPFTHLLKLVCSYKTEAAAIKHAKALAATLRSVATPHSEILGPTPAFYERVRDTYRWQIIVKSPHRHELATLTMHVPSGHWQYELDPVNLL